MLVKRHCCKKKRALSSDRKSPAALMVARDHLSASIWTARHHAGRDLPRSEDRPRHVTNSFDFLFDALEADDPARTGFKPFITPGESADHRTLVQHQLDVAANAFRLDNPPCPSGQSACAVRCSYRKIRRSSFRLSPRTAWQDPAASAGSSYSWRDHLNRNRFQPT